MKKKLVELIICPECNRNKFRLDIQNANDLEIRKGIVQCGHCNKKFQIKDGILHLLLNPGKKIIDEQKGWARLKEAVKNTDELMLSLPDACGPFKEHWAGQARNFHHVFSGLNLNGSEIVLDLGSGRCWSTRFFSKKGCYSIGLDILLPKYVGLLTSDIYISNDNIYFERVCGDMEKLPFRDAIFDLVFISATLHHSSNISIPLQEINRVLKQNGRLVLINESVKGLLRKNITDCDEIKAGINEHSYSLPVYLKEIKKSGFNYDLEFWLGGNNKKIIFINRLLENIIPLKYIDRFIWRPLKHIRLLLFGDTLNLIARKI